MNEAEKQIPRNFVPEPFGYHQELELTIDTLTNLGVGLGRIDEWVVMVPFSLPDGRVRARIFRNHKNYSDADLLEVITPSPERVEPGCALFGQCGGCQYQHLAYSAQLDWKHSQVTELMQRMAGIEHPVEAVHGSPEAYGYRSKLTPHFQKPGKGKDVPIGFLRYGQRNSIIDVPQCPIATDAINAALPEERRKIKSGERKFKKGGTLMLRHTLEGVTNNHQEIVSERVGGLIFQFLAGDFFQNNPFILPAFLEYGVKQAAGAGVPNLVDAYCGSGAFALTGAKHFERVLGVEINASAVRWANTNAKVNRIENAQFRVGEAEAIFAHIDFPGDSAAVIIDPPRAGCDEKFLQQLLELAPRRIVYVSCEPSTQARDLQFLLGRDTYRVSRIQPFDLFPQTRHIENVVTLDKA